MKKSLIFLSCFFCFISLSAQKQITNFIPQQTLSPNNFGFVEKTKDHFYFQVEVQGSGSELWVSDGTPSGTRFLKMLRSEKQSTSIGVVHSFENTLYFSYNKSLWVTDGSTEGTIKLHHNKDFNTFYDIKSVNGQSYLYLSENSQNEGEVPKRSVYKIDGDRLEFLAEDVISTYTSDSSFYFTKIVDEVYRIFDIKNLQTPLFSSENNFGDVEVFENDKHQHLVIDMFRGIFKVATLDHGTKEKVFEGDFKDGYERFPNFVKRADGEVFIIQNNGTPEELPTEVKLLQLEQNEFVLKSSIPISLNGGSLPQRYKAGFAFSKPLFDGNSEIVFLASHSHFTSLPQVVKLNIENGLAEVNQLGDRFQIAYFGPWNSFELSANNEFIINSHDEEVRYNFDKDEIVERFVKNKFPSTFFKLNSEVIEFKKNGLQNFSTGTSLVNQTAVNSPSASSFKHIAIGDQLFFSLNTETELGSSFQLQTEVNGKPEVLVSRKGNGKVFNMSTQEALIGFVVHDDSLELFVSNGTQEGTSFLGPFKGDFNRFRNRFLSTGDSFLFLFQNTIVYFDGIGVSITPKEDIGFSQVMVNEGIYYLRINENRINNIYTYTSEKGLSLEVFNCSQFFGFYDGKVIYSIEDNRPNQNKSQNFLIRSKDIDGKVELIANSTIYPSRLLNKILIGENEKAFLLDLETGVKLEIPTYSRSYSANVVGNTIFLGSTERDSNLLTITSFSEGVFNQKVIPHPHKGYQTWAVESGILIFGTYDSLGTTLRAVDYFDVDRQTYKRFLREEYLDENSLTYSMQLHRQQGNLTFAFRLNGESKSYMWDTKDKAIKPFTLEVGNDLNLSDGIYYYGTTDSAGNKTVLWKSTPDGLKKLDLRYKGGAESFSYLSVKDEIYYLAFTDETGWELNKTDFDNVERFEEIQEGPTGWGSAIEAFTHNNQVYIAGGTYKDGFQVWQLSLAEEDSEEEVEEVLSLQEDDEMVFVYPNPTTDYINVKIDMPFEYTIYNLKGQFITSGKALPNELISIKKLNSRFGLIRISNAEGTIVKRIVKY